MATRRVSRDCRRRGKRRKPKSIKRGRQRRADANGSAKRAKRRAPDRAPDRAKTCPQRADNAPTAAAVQAPARAKPCHECLECGHRRLWLRRGLCCACYRNPIIRGRHFSPENTILARNPEIWDALDLLAGRDIPAASAGPCPGPLPGSVGSPERLLALGLRADAQLSLFPQDRGPCPLAEVARLFGVTVDVG